MSTKSAATAAKNESSCLVVGAGIAGLLAATTLHGAGHDVIVVDKGRGVGGRMATRRVDVSGGPEARLDHGAQYFTARHPRFRRLVAQWTAAGVVRKWSEGFHTPDGPKMNGEPRYRGARGMTDVAKHLAAPLDVRTGVRLTSVSHDGSRWTATAGDGATYHAPLLLLTPPVPQSLALLENGQVPLPQAAKAALRGIIYEPTFAVLAVLDGPSGLPAPGGLWPDDGPISWLADNAQKGISSRPAVTIHAMSHFTMTHFEDDRDAVARRLLDAAAPFLDAQPVTYQVQRWRYATPILPYPERTLRADSGGPLFFAGDAFGGPRVEGAALSGLAAGDAMLNVLTTEVSQEQNE
jgi:hypothetical protein